MHICCLTASLVKKAYSIIMHALPSGKKMTSSNTITSQLDSLRPPSEPAQHLDQFRQPKWYGKAAPRRDPLLTCLACLLALRISLPRLFTTPIVAKRAALSVGTVKGLPDAALAELEWVAVWRSEMAKKSTFAPRTLRVMVCPYHGLHEVEHCPVDQLCTM